MDSPKENPKPEEGQDQERQAALANPQLSEENTNSDSANAPLASENKSKRSIFNIDSSQLGMLEPITKAVTIGAIVSYAVGFLVIEINEGMLGFLDASLLRPRAMIVGAVALLLIALPISFTRGSYIRPPEKEKESKGHAFARLSLSIVDYLCACGMAWFLASFVFVGSFADTMISVENGKVVRHTIQFFGWFVCILVITINGVLAFPTDRRKYWKAPRLWSLYSVFMLALIVFAICAMWRTGSATYFVWSLLTPILFHAYASDWRRGVIHSLKLTPVLFWSLTVLSVYSANLFPRIKSNWGGGKPIPALLTVASSSGSKGGEELLVDLVEATDSGYYVILAGQKNVVYFPKASAQLIEFTTQIGR